MAANKFASMVYRSTNKITLILIYALLEWTLIYLLLLNSFFSYLIIKFAQYFGLNPPCLWCSRVDHIFEPGKNKNYHRDLLCKVHLAEISKLGFCSNHQKLAESQDMCLDCFSSSTPHFHELVKNFALKKDGVEVIKKDEVILKCSCCDGCLESASKYSEYILVNSTFWDASEISDKKELVKDVEDYDHLEEDMKIDVGRTFFVSDQCQKIETFLCSEVVTETEKTEEGLLSECEPEQKEMEIYSKKESIVDEIQGAVMKDQSVQVSFEEDESNEIFGQHLEFFFDGSGHGLVPVELIDSPVKEDKHRFRRTDNNQENVDTEGAHMEFEIMNVEVENKLEDEIESEVEFSPRNGEQSKFSVFESMEMEEDDNSLVFNAREFPSVKEMLEQIAITQNAQEFKALATIEEENKHSDGEVSIGTEIPDVDTADDIHPQDMVFDNECSQENLSTSCSNMLLDDSHSVKQVEEETVELRSLSVELSEHIAISESSFIPVVNSVEESKLPDTPTSVDSTQNSSKNSVFHEKDSGAEDSLSELECGDGMMTIESLKSALRSEQKTLQSLYAELEEERSASAVAANQTMAMINRLQEEKAQMQMEALQYQRMMEEQSEYDQEALQLLNELMVKREKEKQQLEKELEIYRRKVVEFETKEKLRILRKSKDGSSNRCGFSSASCSNAEDSDVLSIDLNQEVKDEDGFNGYEAYCNGHSPVDAVLSLEESLSDFEEERVSILEQLKILEVKLMTLDDEEEKQNSEDLNPLDQFPEENGHQKIQNGHQERRTIGAKGRNLLPLFDAANDENGGNELDGIENGFDSNGVHDLDIRNLYSDSKKLDVEEQVEHLYERLQALEADREFVKHCMSSLRKGDKGVHLLQEILQHLRDLKNVELRVRNFDDDVAI